MVPDGRPLRATLCGRVVSGSAAGWLESTFWKSAPRAHGRIELADSKHPDPLSRRLLLDGDLESSKALAIAKAYLEDDREVEAVDFLAAADPASNDEAKRTLHELQKSAVEHGDVFLMRSASAALGEDPSTETWRALAESAANAGRPMDVESAERLAAVNAG